MKKAPIVGPFSLGLGRTLSHFLHADLVGNQVVPKIVQKRAAPLADIKISSIKLEEQSPLQWVGRGKLKSCLHLLRYSFDGHLSEQGEVAIVMRLGRFQRERRSWKIGHVKEVFASEVPPQFPGCNSLLTGDFQTIHLHNQLPPDHGALTNLNEARTDWKCAFFFHPNLRSQPSNGRHLRIQYITAIQRHIVHDMPDSCVSFGATRQRFKPTGLQLHFSTKSLLTFRQS